MLSSGRVPSCDDEESSALAAVFMMILKMDQSDDDVLVDEIETDKQGEAGRQERISYVETFVLDIPWACSFFKLSKWQWRILLRHGKVRRVLQQIEPAICNHNKQKEERDAKCSSCWSSSSLGKLAADR